VFYVSLKRVVEDSPLRVGPTSFILRSKLFTTFHPPFYWGSKKENNVPPHRKIEQAGEEKGKRNRW